MSYSPEWILAGFVTLVAFLCAPPLALIAFGVLVLVALGALLALAATIAASPYLLLRSVRRRWAQSHADRRHAESTSRRLSPMQGERMWGTHGGYIS
jgi:membrane protein implicated in regulation of membrane protease activity